MDPTSFYRPARSTDLIGTGWLNGSRNGGQRADGWFSASNHPSQRAPLAKERHPVRVRQRALSRLACPARVPESLCHQERCPQRPNRPLLTARPSPRTPALRSPRDGRRYPSSGRGRCNTPFGGLPPRDGLPRFVLATT